jgi:transposase
MKWCGNQPIRYRAQLPSRRLTHSPSRKVLNYRLGACPSSAVFSLDTKALAHFIRNLVRDDLDLSAILETYAEERGFPPYHPVMMTALLLYAYCQGVYSSRRIAVACEQRLDFMAVTALQKPDFRTISDFRKRHLKVLGALFGQVLLLCEQAGLVQLGHVALDGTKIKANASKHKAMSYGRMKQREAELAAEVQEWLAQAAATDAAEDEALGRDGGGRGSRAGTGRGGSSDALRDARRWCR